MVATVGKGDAAAVEEVAVFDPVPGNRVSILPVLVALLVLDSAGLVVVPLWVPTTTDVIAGCVVGSDGVVMRVVELSGWDVVLALADEGMFDGDKDAEEVSIELGVVPPASSLARREASDANDW